MPFLTQSILLRTTLWKHFKLFTDMLLPPKYRNGSHKQMKKKSYKISIDWFCSRLMLFSRHLTRLGTRRYAVKASFFIYSIWFEWFIHRASVWSSFLQLNYNEFCNLMNSRSRKKEEEKKEEEEKSMEEEDTSWTKWSFSESGLSDVLRHILSYICTYLQTDCVFHKNYQL